MHLWFIVDREKDIFLTPLHAVQTDKEDSALGVPFTFLCFKCLTLVSGGELARGPRLSSCSVFFYIYIYFADPALSLSLLMFLFNFFSTSAVLMRAAGDARTGVCWAAALFPGIHHPCQLLTAVTFLSFFFVPGSHVHFFFSSPWIPCNSTGSANVT